MSSERLIVVAFLFVLLSVSPLPAQSGSAACVLQVDLPSNGQDVGKSVEVKGKAQLLPDRYIWALVQVRTDEGKARSWWPQLPGPVNPDGTWSVLAGIGSPEDVKFKKWFNVAVIVVDSDRNRYLQEYNETARERNYPPIEMPAAACPPIIRAVRKVSHSE